MTKIVISLIIVVLTISVALFVCDVTSVEASQSGTVYGSDVIVYSDEASVGNSFMLYTKYEFSTGGSSESNSKIVVESGEEHLNTPFIDEPPENQYTKYTVGIMCNDPGMIVEVYGALYTTEEPSYSLWLTCNSESGKLTHTVQFTRPSLPSLKIYVSSQNQSNKYTYPVSLVYGFREHRNLLFNGFSINGNNPNPVETFSSTPNTYILTGQDYFEDVKSLKLLFNTYDTTTKDTLNIEVNLRVVIDGVLYEVFNGYETSFDMTHFVFGETGITINSSNYSFYQDFIAEFEGSYITSAQMEIEALRNGDYRYTINVYMKSYLWSDNYYSGAIVLFKDIFINVMDVLSVDILPNISVLDIFGVVVFVGFAFFIFKLLGY